MEQRDYLVDQIEKMGKVLAKMLSDFLRLKSKGQVSQGIEIANQYLKEEVDLQIDQILTLPKAELKAYFEKRNLTADHLEIIANYVKEMGQSQKKDGNFSLAAESFEKSSLILTLADEAAQTISFERMQLQDELKKLKSNL